MSTTGYANVHCSTTGVSVRGASLRVAHRRYRLQYNHRISDRFYKCGEVRSLMSNDKSYGFGGNAPNVANAALSLLVSPATP
ncbi:hypothetical protein [Nostoc sp.]|uniref:hypothetical protein n=1 Tax=Nostoc sp. TaxID=1180 RepID=UPI002FFCF3D2